MIGLLFEVQGLRGAELHSGGHLVAADAALEAGVFRVLGRVPAVQFAQKQLGGCLALRSDVLGGFMGEKIRDGVLASGVDDGAAVVSGKKGGLPVFDPIGGHPAMVWEDHKAGEIFVEPTEPVADPATCTREARKLKSCGLEEGGGGVDTGLAHHVVDEGNLIHDSAER